MTQTAQNQIRRTQLFNLLLHEKHTEDAIFAAVETSPSFGRFLVTLGSKIPRLESLSVDFGSIREALRS